MKNNKKRNLLCSLLLAAALVALLLYIDNSPLKSSMLSTVLQKGAIYALLVVSMNLLNGFTGPIPMPSLPSRWRSASMCTSILTAVLCSSRCRRSRR